MVRNSLTLPLALAIGITGSAAPVAAMAQDGGASRLSLTRAEWRCLQARLDQYLRDAANPKLASVLGCGRPPASDAAPPIRRDPIFAPRPGGPGNGADADAARKVFFLTEAQIRCLKEAIPTLIERDDADQRIDYDFSTCPAAVR